MNVPAGTLAPVTTMPATMVPVTGPLTVSTCADAIAVDATAPGTLTAYVPAAPVPFVPG